MSQPKNRRPPSSGCSKEWPTVPNGCSRNPLRTLKQYLWSLSHEDFLPYRAARMVPLADAGGTIPRLLQHLEPEQAEGSDGNPGQVGGHPGLPAESR